MFAKLKTIFFCMPLIFAFGITYYADVNAIPLKPLNVMGLTISCFMLAVMNIDYIKSKYIEKKNKIVQYIESIKIDYKMLMESLLDKNSYVSFDVFLGMFEDKYTLESPFVGKNYIFYYHEEEYYKAKKDSQGKTKKLSRESFRKYHSEFFNQK